MNKKYLLLIAFTLMFGLGAFAQAPNPIGYQLGIRGANNLPLANKGVRVRVSILDSSINGPVQFTEIHQVTTNATGIVRVDIGRGNSTLGNFFGINWAGAPKFLRSEVDTGTGTFSLLSTTPFLSVPYAAYAQSGTNGVPAGGSHGQVLARCNGQIVWTNAGLCPGESPYFLAGSVFCNGVPTVINEVINPTTGRTWMDRNLGAARLALNKTDTGAYGDLFQWGRRMDGHQCRNSGTTSNLSLIDTPSHANFILTTTTPSDWRSGQNVNLWQGSIGANNPCPLGFRLPTESEMLAERASWGSSSSIGAFASPLKWVEAGSRLQDGTLSIENNLGFYWSSTISGTRSVYLNISSGAAITPGWRGAGMSVRCIRH